MAFNGEQQLVVMARYTDGSVEDVTRSALYEPNDKELAKTDETGQDEDVHAQEGNTQQRGVLFGGQQTEIRKPGHAAMLPGGGGNWQGEAGEERRYSLIVCHWLRLALPVPSVAFVRATLAKPVAHGRLSFFSNCTTTCFARHLPIALTTC